MTTYTPNNLLAGLTMPQVTDQVTLEADVSNDLSLAIGTVIALKSNGKCVIVNSQAQGETDPHAVLAEATTVLHGSDTVAPVYLTGEFNSAALVFGGSDTTDTHKTAMRNKGMFIKSNIPA